MSSEIQFRPAYCSSGASGADVTYTLMPSCRALIPTGVFAEIPLGLEIQVRARSGLAYEKGLAVLNSPGTIDADYRGEIKVILYSSSQTCGLRNAESARGISHRARREGLRAYGNDVNPVCVPVCGRFCYERAGCE